MPKAYPIISTDIKSQLEPVFKYLKTFKNLYLAGRNAEFKYTHTHNIFKNANLLIEQIIKTVNWNYRLIGFAKFWWKSLFSLNQILLSTEIKFLEKENYF